jgi:hypothetical protein
MGARKRSMKDLGGAGEGVAEAEATREILVDFEVGSDAGRGRDHGASELHVRVAVRADHVVLFEHGRGGEHDVRELGGVGEERVEHDDGESTRLDRARDGGRVREHRDGVAGGDPERLDLRVLRREHLLAEERLADASGPARR